LERTSDAMLLKQFDHLLQVRASCWFVHHIVRVRCVYDRLEV
jgi:hypothetical protein